MDCENCENYKQKKDKAFQPVAEIIDNALLDYCTGRDCDGCALQISAGECRKITISAELRQAGADV